MKKVIFLTSAIALFACQNNSQSKSKGQDSTAQEVQSIGGNKDKHGCLTAAGQTWSQIKNDCIQVFSIGIRLNPIKVDSTDAIISAFVVPNADSSAYELFLSNQQTTIILSPSAGHTFTKDQYKYQKNSGELFINNKLTYKTE